MLSTKSPSGIHKRRQQPKRSEPSGQFSPGKSESPQRRPRQQGLGLTNPLGLRHLTQILDHGPTLEYSPQHIMQEAQQHRPAQPGYSPQQHQQQQHHQQQLIDYNYQQQMQMRMIQEQQASAQHLATNSFYNTCRQYAQTPQPGMTSPMMDYPHTPRVQYMPTPPNTARPMVPMYYGLPAEPMYYQSPCPSPTHVQMAIPDVCQPMAYIVDSPMMPPLSPREAMLAGLNVDASIEETGISAEEVQSFMSEQDPVDQKWTCLFEDCGKKFGRKENIRSHVQTHLGDRQFKCNACNKCFVRQHDLKRHAKIHSGYKPYVCPCGNGFARQDALTRHRQRGVCEGALPGCERREVKRGRPKKVRGGGGDDDDDDDDKNAASSPESDSSPETPSESGEHMTAFINAYDGEEADVKPSSRHISPDLPSNMLSDVSWGTTEQQPSLCTDTFSPAPMSSSAMGDFEEDDSFLRDAFGGAVKDPGECSLLNFGAAAAFDGSVSVNGPSHLDTWLQS